MKEISVTETVHVTKYVAVDNTVFTSKSECEKYEQTAECALMQRYKPLVVKTVTEYDIFACGSDDSVVDVIKLTEAKDIDTVIQLYRLRNSHLERPEYKKWIDEAHKKPLPRFPRRIGVVTSLAGAVLRDIYHVSSRRWPLVQLVLYPVQVQGEGAAEQIAEAIGFFNRSCSVDTLIVGRGGGSMEDAGMAL